MFNDISCDRKGQQRRIFGKFQSRHLQRNLVLDNGHLLVQVLKRSGILEKRIAHKEHGIVLRTKCCWKSQKADILCSDSIEGYSQAKDMENCQYTSLQIVPQLKQFFATISVNQLSIYGAVAAVCEEFETHQDGSGEPDVLRQRFLCRMKTLQIIKILWQQYMERIESLSPENNEDLYVLKWDSISWPRQWWFLTSSFSGLSWIHSSPRRSIFNQKDDSRKHQPILNMANMGLKFESGLWVKIILSLGSEYLVERTRMWSSQIKTTQKSLQIHMKIKRHNQVSRLLQPEPVDTPSIDIEPSAPFLTAYDLSKKVISLLRHNQTVQREDDGASQFWRSKFHLRNQFSQLQHWRKTCLAAGRGSKRRYQHCSDDSGRTLHLRALQGHSGHNLIDLMSQDNAVIQRGFFQHIYHIGCAFNLHLIINNGLIIGGQDLSRRQTVFFLPIDPRDKDHEDPAHIDFSVPHRTQYLHSAWKKHQDAVFWVDLDLSIKEGLVFYQTRSNAIILQGTLPAHCIVKVERLKTGEKLYERQYLSPWPPPKISLKHDLNWTKGNDQGSTVEQQPVGGSTVTRRSSTRSVLPDQNQSVIDQGNLMARKTCLLLKVKRPVPTRSMKKVCTKNWFFR